MQLWPCAGVVSAVGAGFWGVCVRRAGAAVVSLEEAGRIAYFVAVLPLQSTKEVMDVSMVLMSRSLNGIRCGDECRYGRLLSSRKAEASLHATRFTADRSSQ